MSGTSPDEKYQSTILNTIFADNIGRRGPAFFISSSLVSITNSGFNDNKSTESASGLYVNQSIIDLDTVKFIK